jgi:tetratricopeptide (TPR) repeat protein
VSVINRLFGRWRNTHYASGIEHFNRREFAEAIAEFRQLLDEVQDPSSPDVELARFYSAEAHAKLGQSFLHKGEFARAEDEFRHAIQVEGAFPDLYYYLGILAAREGRSEDALRFLDRALELNPNYIEALAGRALVLERLGRSAAASPDLKRLALLSVPIADACSYQPRPPISTHALEDLKIPRTDDGYLNLALEHHDRGTMDEALGAMEQAIADCPEYADLRWRYGQILAEMNRREEAVAAFDEALSINPDFIEALLARSLCLVVLERSEDALTSLVRAAGLRPAYADIAYYEGVASLRTGNTREALAPLARALEINPCFWRARFVMGQVHLALGERDRGVAELEDALEHQPALISERGGTGTGSPDRAGGALEYLGAAVATHPEYPDLRVQLGMAYMDSGQLEPARDEFEEAARLNPDYVQAHCHLGKVEFAAERPGEAILHLTRAVDLAPGMADVHCMLGEAHMATGNEAGSEVAFNRALTLNPRYVDALVGLASVRRRQSCENEAQGLYRKVLDIEPDHPVVSARIGGAFKEGEARKSGAD